MSIVQFTVGDKDYIDKLNQMSQNAGDTAQFRQETEQLKNDTEQLKADTQTIKQQTDDIRAQAQAIVSGDLIFTEAVTTRNVNHGDMILAASPGIEFLLDNFKANIVVGQWFTIENTSGSPVFVVSRSDLALVGNNATISNGDRFIISPGNSFTFRAINTSELRIK